MPASIPAVAWAVVADECPADTTVPRAASAATTSRARGSSGASVTSATPPAADQPSASTSAGSGRARCSVRWAPRRSGDRNGPSRCRPRGVAQRARSIPAAVRPAGRPGPGPDLGGPVTMVGSQAVTPTGAAAPPPPTGARARPTGRCPRHRCTAGRRGRAPPAGRRRRSWPHRPGPGHTAAGVPAAGGTWSLADVPTTERSAPAPTVPCSLRPPGPPGLLLVPTSATPLTMRPPAILTSAITDRAGASTVPPVMTNAPSAGTVRGQRLRRRAHSCSGP